MSLRPIKRLTICRQACFCFRLAWQRAQTPSPEAMAAKRASWVTTLKLSDQYKALLPVILLGLKPRFDAGQAGKSKRDYEAMLPAVADGVYPLL